MLKVFDVFPNFDEFMKFKKVRSGRDQATDDKSFVGHHLAVTWRALTFFAGQGRAPSNSVMSRDTVTLGQ